MGESWGETDIIDLVSCTGSYMPAVFAERGRKRPPP